MEDDGLARKRSRYNAFPGRKLVEINENLFQKYFMH